MAKARYIRRRVSKKMLLHGEEVIKARAYPHDMVAKMKSVCSPQLLPDFAKVQDVVGGPRYTKHDPAWLTDEASQLSSLLWRSFVTRHPSWKWAVVVGEEEVIEQVDEKEALAAEDEHFNFASINTQPGSIPLLTKDVQCGDKSSPIRLRCLQCDELSIQIKVGRSGRRSYFCHLCKLYKTRTGEPTKQLGIAAIGAAVWPTSGPGISINSFET